MNNYNKKFEKELSKMREIIRNGSEEEKQKYSQDLLENGDVIFSNNAAYELGIDTLEHLRKILNCGDIGIVYLGFENCLENKFLSKETRFNLVIEFYEKIIYSKHDENFNVKMRATKKLESISEYKEYLKDKPSSEEYRKMFIAWMKELKQRKLEADNQKILLSFGQLQTINQQLYGRLIYGIESLDEKSKKVISTNNPYFSYKFIKDVLKTTKLDKETKKNLVMPHAEFVFNSNDQETIEKLITLLQPKPLYTEYVITRTRKLK